MFRRLVLAATLALAAPAGAATVQLVTDASLVTPLVSGTYGVEVRGGSTSNGNSNWELGVGTQIANNPGNGASFAAGQVTWPALPALMNYTLTWASGRVQMTVGSTTVGWDAAWQTGNAVTISMRGQAGSATVTVGTLDGVALNWTNTVSQGATQSFTFWGTTLRNGWTMTGQIGMTSQGGQNRWVRFAASEYTPSVPVPAALPMLALGLGSLVLLGRRRKAVTPA